MTKGCVFFVGEGGVYDKDEDISICHTTLGFNDFNDAEKEMYENIVEKVETEGSQCFLLSPQYFTPYQRRKPPFELHLICHLQMLSNFSSPDLCPLVKSLLLSLRYPTLMIEFFNRVISDISVVPRETTLNIFDSIEKGSPVETFLIFLHTDKMHVGQC